MKKLLNIQVTLLFFCMIISGIGFGQVPQLINYQGILIDPSKGLPVPDDTYSITFSIYNVSSGGSAIWSETQSVQTKDGLYSVLLGSTTTLTSTILSGPEKYLGIKVGSDEEMTPRKRIVSVAYAILSEDANKLDGKHASAFADSIHNHDDRYYTETELNTSDGDPPNQGSNRLSWDNLKDMPEGFADGVDNTSGGGAGWLDDGTVVRLETSSDKVGIGTLIPAEKLSVMGNVLIKQSEIGTAGLILSSSSVSQNINATNNLKLDYGGNLSINHSGTENMRITSDGKVGIGITNPTCKLEVADTIYSSAGGYKFPDGSVQSKAATSSGDAWNLIGNSGTVPGTHFLGTTDNQALELKVNNKRALRVEPTSQPESPNLIGGYSGNSVTAGAVGTVISGGGTNDYFLGQPEPNIVTDHYGTIGGGVGNQTGNNDGTLDNAINATVAGGYKNTASNYCSSIGGGESNTASGYLGTIGGGQYNIASGGTGLSTIAGGSFNQASNFATVGGGSRNIASGGYSTVPGGQDNTAQGEYSFAAGTNAKANHNGTFVWSDNSGDDFASTADNQFIIRASGGVGIGTSAPSGQLHVATNRRYAGYFTSDSSDATAIFAEANGGIYSTGIEASSEGGLSNIGIEAYANGGHASVGILVSGVGGEETTGIKALASGGITSKGIHAVATGAVIQNFAGYFDGDVRVIGQINPTASSFKIDHPADPANKYLSHSSVESPDMMNVYNGNVILDTNGEVWVELPEWFEALNKDFRYQLTCIGGFAQLYVAEEIKNNRFKIAGGVPGLKVSWQVTGIRHDPYAEQNRFQVEEMKKSDERGKYLHPEAYGLPENMGIGYEERQRMEEERSRVEEKR